MVRRSRSIVLGVLLLLLGFASLSTSAWPPAPMEEPAAPGKTPDPSKHSPFLEWWLYPSVRILQTFRYAGVLGGITCLAVGTMLLAPKRSERR